MFKLPLKSINIFLILLLFIKESFDGAFRYFLSLYGLVPIIYIPTILIGVFVIIYLVYKFDIVLNKYLFIELCALILWFGMSLFHNKSIAQSIYGLYILIPFFFGQISIDFFAKDNKWFFRVFVLLSILTFTGALLDMNTELPWKGFDYDVGNVKVEGNRAWATMGIDRISGFSRSSFALAILSMFFLIYLYRKVSNGLFIFLWLINGVSIILTTTKGVILTFLVFTILLVIRQISMFVYRVGLKFLVITSILICVILPLTCLWFDYSLGLNSVLLILLFESFEMRLLDTWPDAFKLLDNWSSYISGNGYGSIGVASMMFDHKNYSPADNLFVYFFVIFGICALFLFIWIGYKMIVSNISKNNEFLSHGLVFIFIYGIFSNVIENPILGFLLGVIISYLANYSNRLSTE